MLRSKLQDLNLSSKRKIPTKVFLVKYGRFQRIILRFADHAARILNLKLSSQKLSFVLKL